MASEAINTLHAAGVERLRSCYFVGNEESMAWHQRFGFVEEPDSTRARIVLYGSVSGYNAAASWWSRFNCPAFDRVGVTLAARDAGRTLEPDEQAELEALVEAQLEGAAQRAGCCAI